MPFLIYKINICLDPFLFFLIIFINIYMYLLLLFLLLLQLFELYYMICTVPLYCMMKGIEDKKAAVNVGSLYCSIILYSVAVICKFEIERD